MSTCIVYLCPGEMRGQMIACAAHWSFLPEALRLEVIEAWDQLAAERRAGNPRRATRDRLARLKTRAAAVLEEACDNLERAGGRQLGPDGRAWLREHRRLAAAAAEAEQHTTSDAELAAALEAAPDA